MRAIYHTEECSNTRCTGQCHEVLLECLDCAWEEVYDEEDTLPSKCPDCDEELTCGAADPDEAAAERKQMGIT